MKQSGDRPLRINCVVPKWNGGDYFFSALERLQQQTYPFSQIVISDDNSNDGSLDKVRALDGQNGIKVIVPPERLPGMGANVAFGLEHLDDADYTLIGSVDDLWHPNFVHDLVHEVLIPAGDVAGVFTDRWIIDEAGKLTGCTGSRRHPLISSAGDWNYYLSACRFIVHGALFRTQYLKEMIGALKVSGQTADWVMIAEAARRGRIVYYPFPLWQFRIHSASTSATRKSGHAQNLRGYAEYLLTQGDEAHAGDVRRLVMKLEETIDDPAANWARKAGRRDPHSRGRLRVVLATVLHGSGLSRVLRPWLRRVYRSAHVN